MWTGGASPNAYTTGRSLAALAHGWVPAGSLPAGEEAVVVAVVVADTRSTPVMTVVVVVVVVVAVVVVQAISHNHVCEVVVQ